MLNAKALEDVFIQSLINPIPKKGDLSDTGSRHETLQQDSHAANPVGRRLPHETLFLRDTALTKKYPLHGCFVDFSKAFDSVYWEAIVRIQHTHTLCAESWHTYVFMIYVTTHNHTLPSCYGGESRVFKMPCNRCCRG
eukprot:PhF_6_TR44202/c2_g1_i4/m.67837